MNKRNGDFTYTSLIQMYSELLKKYKVVSFSTGLVSKESSLLLIRHDIDICPEKALRIGMIEKDLGIRSAYFFMTDCPVYNIFSDRVQFVIRELRECGHEIGLHYDHLSELALSSNTDIYCVKDMMQRRLDCQINLISFHKPDQKIPKEKYCFGMINVFAEHFTERFKYFSDSWGRWRFGNPLESAEVQAGESLYLNLHPEWWGERPEKIYRVKAEMVRRFGDIMIDYWDKEIIPIYVDRSERSLGSCGIVQTGSDQ